MSPVSKAGSRRRARDVAMQAIYLVDLNPSVEPSLLSRFLAGRLVDAESRTFASGLLEGTRRHVQDIDRLLEASCDNWRVSRMAATDRSILRLAAHEILHTDTPPRVACDEAVELAKRYGAAASPRFVAGVLGRLLHDRGVGLPSPGQPPLDTRPVDSPGAATVQPATKIKRRRSEAG